MDWAPSEYAYSLGGRSVMWPSCHRLPSKRRDNRGYHTGYCFAKTVSSTLCSLSDLRSPLITTRTLDIIWRTTLYVQIPLLLSAQNLHKACRFSTRFWADQRQVCECDQKCQKPGRRPARSISIPHACLAGSNSTYSVVLVCLCRFTTVCRLFWSETGFKFNQDRSIGLIEFGVWTLLRFVPLRYFDQRPA